MSSDGGTSSVVEIRDLVKVYAHKKVLDGVSFSVARGEIFGFLGPNGAGKTTTLEILEGLRAPTSGTVRLFGLDVHKNLKTIRRKIGVSLQQTRYWGLLTVRETIKLFQSLYPKYLPVNVLCDMFNIGEQLDMQLIKLSGGTYQRVVLALALVNDPELVLLDEPTTGLDPQARRRLWEVIRQLKEHGKTVVITTHYMDEAQALCGRVAIIDKGRIIRSGSPDALIRSLDAGAAISFGTSDEVDLATLSSQSWCRGARRLESGKYIAYCPDIKTGITGLMQWAATQAVNIGDVETRTATLDDVFLRLSSTPEEVLS